MSKNSIGVKGLKRGPYCLETDRHKISNQAENIYEESKHFKAADGSAASFPALEGSSSGLKEVYLWLKWNLLSMLEGSTYSLGGVYSTVLGL